MTITNVRNQPPQWEKDSYNVVIPENTARDTPIVVRQFASLIVWCHSCVVRFFFYYLRLELAACLVFVTEVCTDDVTDNIMFVSGLRKNWKHIGLK